MKSLGYDDAKPDISCDPLTDPRTYELLEQHESNKIRRNDVSSLLAKAPKPRNITLQQYNLLKEVPLDPKLRLADKPKGKAVAVK